MPDSVGHAIIIVLNYTFTMDEFDLGMEFLELTKRETEDDWLSNVEGVKEVFDPETEKLLKQF